MYRIHPCLQHCIFFLTKDAPTCCSVTEESEPARLIVSGTTSYEEIGNINRSRRSDSTVTPESRQVGRRATRVKTCLNEGLFAKMRCVVFCAGRVHIIGNPISEANLLLRLCRWNRQTKVIGGQMRGPYTHAHPYM